jgi:glutaredoxin-like YruB-family protein
MIPPNADNKRKRSRWLPLILLFGVLPLAIHHFNESSGGGDMGAGSVALAATSGLATYAPVVMYSTQWCPYCSRARAYFKRNGISFVEYDIEASAQNRAQFKALNGRGVPLIMVGDKRLQGFNPQSFEALLK